jgi:glycerol dehydrogenase
MLNTTIFPGRYVQGRDATQRLGQELSRYGEKGMVVCDPFVYEQLLPGIESYMKDSVEVFVEKFDGECSDEEINRLVELVIQEKFQFVVGMGGVKPSIWLRRWLMAQSCRWRLCPPLPLAMLPVALYL